MNTIIAMMPLVAAVAFWLHTVRKGRKLRASMHARARWCDELLAAAKDRK